MDEYNVRENNISNTQPRDDRPSSDNGSEDTFLSLSPDSSWGSKRVENISTSPNVDKNGSSKKDDLKVGSPNVEKNNGSNKEPEKNEPKVAAHIDTAAPFESVKEAVSKFGVIVDWKAHRAQTSERRQYIEQELEKAQQEIPVYKQRAEQAEQEKEQALQDLNNIKRVIQELKLKLERAQTEERQAKQDSELANLRVQEMEQGVADESSVAAKTELEVAKARHQAAASELVAAGNELEETRKDYQVLIAEKDAAVQKANEAVSASKEIERQVEDLTIQLITTKESIESTHALHLEAEEQRYQEVKELDQAAIDLDVDLKQTEEELEKVKNQIIVAKELRSKLETSSGVLRSLKDELAVYMQGKEPEVMDEKQITRKNIQSGVANAKQELEAVNGEIAKTSEEIMCLKTAATSLTAKLESEKQTLTNVRKQKGLGAGAVVNLESELKRTRVELDDIRKREKEAREKLVELPKRLQKAVEESEKALSLVEEARSELKKAQETAEEAKTGVNSISGRIAATQKQIEAARAQERIALGALNALCESESTSGQKKEEKNAVTISLQEYYELSKQAHADEEAAKMRVEEAESWIDEAKEAEMQSLIKLTQLNSENAARKDALNAALQRAEMARETTTSIEQELRKRKGEDEPTQKAEAPRVGLFKRLSQKASHDAPSPNPSSSNATAQAKGDGTDASGNEGESSTDGKGFFRRRKKMVMPKLNLININMNMKKKPSFFGKKDNNN